MIIGSIDLMDGEAVQLVGGAELELNAGDPRPLARRFGRVGPVAVIDLDAALGRGENSKVVESLLPLARCRVGGGIRSAEAALRWLDAGADSVILGTAAVPEVLRELPRERVWAALDCVHGEVVDEGWTRRTGRTVLDRIAELREYVGGFLVTFVESEGRMTGIDLERVEKLAAAAGPCQLTVAGGIASTDEIAALDALGVDAQVGMALYTGAIELVDAFLAPIQSDRADRLFPTVVCNEHGVALGLAYSDRDSVAVALDDGVGAYRSRKRGLWKKGESSGATQQLIGIDVDCDRDTLRFRVRQAGTGFCHRETATCWGPMRGLAALDRTVGSRIADAPEGSYTATLLADRTLLDQKIEEEAAELVDANTSEEVVWEAADLLYFALVKARTEGVSLADIERELDRRARQVTRRSSAKPLVQADLTLLPDRSPAEAKRRSCAVDPGALRRAGGIVDEVRRDGSDAVVRWSVALGDLDGASDRWVFTRRELEASVGRVDVAVRDLLERTAGRIRRFATAQRAMFRPVEVEVEGGTAGHLIAPVASAGCYAPGGRYPLPSSVLMTAVTAEVAGVERVVVATPRPDDVTMAAAAIAGADALVAVGGAQAIAALAYGAGDLDPVDVIVGPGNAWVTAAKKLVAGDVGIDMLAGPSELVVVADGSVGAEVVAADLIAQAEHDPDAVPILVALSLEFAASVRACLADQLGSLPTASVAVQALRNGCCVLVDSVEEALGVADELAPEHLELLVEDAELHARELRNFGSLFVGSGSAEVLGDYGAGPNHVLPTGGTARFCSGLSVAHFLRMPTWLRLDASEQLVRDAVELGRLEGLEGHARSAQYRQSAEARLHR